MKTAKFRGKFYKRPAHTPAIDKRTTRGPVMAWGVTYPGPISLEQFYGKTLDTMASQPRGDYWMPPVSYWNRSERNERIAKRRGEVWGECIANITLKMTTPRSARDMAQLITRRALLASAVRKKRIGK